MMSGYNTKTSGFDHVDTINLKCDVLFVSSKHYSVQYIIILSEKMALYVYVAPSPIM